MFALGFYYPPGHPSLDSADIPGWSIEFPTEDFGEAVDNLFDARNDAAAGEAAWEGASLMVLVGKDGGVVWEPMNEISYEATGEDPSE